MVKRMVRTATRDLELLDLLLLTYWVTVGLMQALFSREILEVHGAVALAVLLVADAAMVAAILLVARRVKQWETGRRLTAKSVLVFFTFYLGFQLLPFYALAVHPHSYEAELLWFDRLLVGQSISAFLDPYLMPGVADFMQLCYATHYLLPFILLGLLLSAGRNQEAEWLATAVAFVVLTGFLLYVLVPARSPYVVAHVPDLAPYLRFSGPVPLGLVGETVREFLHENESFKYDCFPSGHTQLSLTVLIGSWRYHRRSFPAFLVVVSGLIFATLYLRYHYVIDLAAGALLAWLGWRYVPRWVHLFEKRGEAYADSKAAVDFSQEQARNPR